MNVLKRISIILTLILASTNLFSQTEWVSENKDMFKWSPNSNVKIYANSLSGLAFWNYHALTKENKKYNKWHKEGIEMSIPSVLNTGRPWKISFDISNANNKPHSKKYRVFDHNNRGKWHKGNIYWGFEINAKFSIYSTSSYHKYYCNLSYASGLRSYDSETKRWSNDRFSSGRSISIESNGSNTISVYEDGILLHSLNATELSSITVYAGNAAYVKVDNFKVQSQTIYGKVKPHLDAARMQLNKKNYLGAVEYYTKAIKAGYKNYDIYYRRATAYYTAEFYVNAIDDYTNALSYKKTEEAYLYRGLSKMQRNDNSCLEDLNRGGTKGQALARELGSAAAPSKPKPSDTHYTASGTGFVIDPSGYIATNYHVIDGAKGIDVYVTINGKTTAYAARTVVTDKLNDLAIIKINDRRFGSLPPIPYSFGVGTSDVGTSVFAMGYPELSYLGEELKVTDGIISSKTGYQGDVTTYQISAPIQHGNSGGPLFDKTGYLVGITNAGVSSLQNVGYAIKVSYLNNLIDASPEKINIPRNNSLLGLTLTDKIKRLSPYVVIVKIYQSKTSPANTTYRY